MNAEAGEGWWRLATLALLAVRWSGLALAAGFVAVGKWPEFAVAMLVALAQVISWRSALPLAWEIAVSAVSLFAAVSSYLLLFERVQWWDIPTHFALNGLVAVLAARVLRPAGPSSAAIVTCGVVAALVWELMECGGARWVDSSIYIAPTDTLLDIVAGASGAAVASLLWRRDRTPEPGCEPASAPAHPSQRAGGDG